LAIIREGVVKKLFFAVGSASCFLMANAHAQQFEVVFADDIVMNQPSGTCREFARPLVSDTSGKNDSFCALTGTGGAFAGAGETGKVLKQGDTWLFMGSSCQPGVFFRVTCVKIRPVAQNSQN
jgi:hypothetical protein